MGKTTSFLDKIMVGMDGILTKYWIEEDWNLEDWNEKLWNLEGEFCILALYEI